MHATTTHLRHCVQPDRTSCRAPGVTGFRHPQSPVQGRVSQSLFRYATLPGLLLALILTGGCTAYLDEPVAEWREPLGEAFHAQREQQRLNPAPVETSPVTGLDGQAVERSMKVYRQGEDKKQENGNTFQFKFGNDKSKK